MHPPAMRYRVFAATTWATFDGTPSTPGLPAPTIRSTIVPLCKAAQHGQHQPPVRRGGVGHEFAWRPETGLGFGDGGKDVRQVAGGSRQPVEPRHRHHVPRLKLAEQPAKLRAVGLRPARHFAEHLLASGLGQLARLCVNALAVHRYPRIAAFHAAIVRRSCAAKKPNLFTILIWLQIS